MNTLHVLRSKRDTRQYTDQPVDDEVLYRVLDAARMAGSAKNVQPVRMVVVTKQDDKEALRAAGDFATWIHNAPVVIVVTVHAHAGARALFDVGRHAQNLMLAAHAEGLGSCPVTVHHPEVATQVLSLPEFIEAPMIVTIGWPVAGESAPEQIASPRVPLNEYAQWGCWGFKDEAE